jgi:hypothetical protein
METDAGVCPLLGLVDEQGAYLTYPSYENRCYASRSPQNIPLNEQTFFCLGGHQERCPRFQSRAALLQAQEQQDAGAAGAAAAAQAADPAASDDVLNWTEGDIDQSLAEPDAESAWPENASETAWAGPAYNPPPPPPLLPAAADSRARRPAWPLLLAAGTLVATLMVCGLASAGWLGLRALSSQLALQPTGTPLVEGESTATATPSGPNGVVIVIATPTPDPVQATATADAIFTATALALPTATPSPTAFFAAETPTIDPFAPTATWTPIPVFETPTPRDTPTFFPTNTPFVDPGTATPTWTPFIVATTTATAEGFSATFIATPLNIEFGQTSTLSWNVTGIKDMFINGQAISGPTGSMVVRPSVTTTYVLRMIMRDNTVRELSQVVTVSVPSPTATPTLTPTPTSTPFVNMVFAQDLSITSISGQDASCRTGNGCTLFQIQVRNVGNRPAEYQLVKTQTIPVGWGVFFCWAADCEFGNAPPSRTLAAGARDTVSINFRVPSVLFDRDEAVVNVTGSCPACASPPFTQYSNTFRVLVVLPTPTPQSTGTFTVTPTFTPTPTWTPTPTATPTATTPAN